MNHLSGFAVAFRIYDLDNTGYIERGEIQRFLVALLKDNPAIDLDDAQLNMLITQVLLPACLSACFKAALHQRGERSFGYYY